MNTIKCKGCDEHFVPSKGGRGTKGQRLFCSKDCRLSFHKSKLPYAVARNYSLRAEHGIGLEDYNTMFMKQGGLCFICENPETSNSRWGKVLTLAVDHDHKTGKIRGLLCRRCNQVLGKFEDDIKLFKKAISYLE